jgi:hypothetical protein
MSPDSPAAVAKLSSVAQWVKLAGVRPPAVGATLCRVPGCTSLPFAEVSSNQERLDLCLSHYETACVLADDVRPIGRQITRE